MSRADQTSAGRSARPRLALSLIGALVLFGSPPADATPYRPVIPPNPYRPTPTRVKKPAARPAAAARPACTFKIVGHGPAFADGSFAVARFFAPYGVALDGDATLIIADRNNHRVRTLSTSGTVSSLAGSKRGYRDGVAASARFFQPIAIARYDARTIIVADFGNHRIRAITKSMTRTVAGTVRGFADGRAGRARFNGPTGVAVDQGGNIFVADLGNHRIRRVARGRVSTVAGGRPGNVDGPQASARFRRPAGVAVAKNGDIFVADMGNHAIRRIVAGRVSTVAGGPMAGAVDGPIKGALFNGPTALALAAGGRIFVADAGNDRVRLIEDGTVSTLSCGAARLQMPTGIAVASDGTIYVASHGGHQIFIFKNPSFERK